MTKLFWLSDQQWLEIEVLIPKSRWGKPRTDEPGPLANVGNGANPDISGESLCRSQGI